MSLFEHVFRLVRCMRTGRSLFAPTPLILAG
jgi:hypothetical protein